jgi:uncharacterized protein (DUF488 family)
VATELFTVGHSTHPLDEFRGLLARHRVELLVDVRRFPGSRKHPQFNRENLATTLPHSGVDYRWFEALGGRRSKQPGPSPNGVLRNESFRNYADYMATPEFRAAIADLVRLAADKRTAIMCSEGLYWRCHRRLVSDYLTGLGVTVWHIMPSGELKPHTLTDGARFEGEQLTYPPAPSLFE